MDLLSKRTCRIVTKPWEKHTSFAQEGVGLGKRSTNRETGAGLENQGWDVTSTVWWGSLWVGIHTHTQGCSQGARFRRGYHTHTHTLVLAHTHAHTHGCGLAQRSTWGDTVDKVGLWEMFLATCRASILRAASTSSSWATREGWGEERGSDPWSGDGVRRKRGVRVVLASRKY